MAYIKDMSGKRFGRLVVGKFVGYSKHGKGLWLVTCDCGKQDTVLGNSLQSGRTKSCGCLKSVSNNRGKNFINLTGQRFGRLVVIERIPLTDKPMSKRRVPLWKVRCDCGVEKTISGSSLLGGTTRSCGCLRAEIIKLPEGVSCRNKVLQQYKTKAAGQRNLEWGIPDSLFDDLVLRNCFYCGCPPSNEMTSAGSNGTFVYNGIDRSDSSRGYVSDNVVTACWTCNWMKRHLTPEAFLAHIERIHRHQQKRETANA